MARCLGIIISLLFMSLTLASQDEGVLVNDLHSQLNLTRVHQVAHPGSAAEVIKLVKQAGESGRAISIAGGRHSMGGQQFGADTLLLDMSDMHDVLAFDRKRGIVTVEAGIQWPALINFLLDAQQGDVAPWGITQKQTGADNLSIGGALSSNVHGRGLAMQPMVQDVEAFRLVMADGKEVHVSRSENPELFSLVIGGYGLFGVITSVDLRLTKRIKLRRDVEISTLPELMKKLPKRIEDGYLYGDFQFKTDEKADDFLMIGVFSSYKPVPASTPVPTNQRKLDAEKWRQLLALAHSDKAMAFDDYSRYYLGTNGQVYWSDTHQLGFYDQNYDEYLKNVLPGYAPGTLMISEVYVPLDRLSGFMEAVGEDSRRHGTNIIYGTVRLIKKDTETFLPWAQRDYACIVVNLRVSTGEASLARARAAFQRLIDRALDRDGAYFLTYHRWARKDQVMRAYPQFPEFLKNKLKYDPEERFQSDWYRHYKAMFSDEVAAKSAR